MAGRAGGPAADHGGGRRGGLRRAAGAGSGGARVQHPGGAELPVGPADHRPGPAQRRDRPSRRVLAASGCAGPGRRGDHQLGHPLPRVPGPFRAAAGAARGGGGWPTAAWFTWTVAASHAGQLAPGAGTWRLLVLTALLDGRGIPASVFTAPAVGRYLADQGAARPPDPGRAWSALLVLERAGLVAIDTAGAPPAVWVSPALQAAVRAVAPPELLAQAARSAADALAEVWPADQPAVLAGRGPAGVRRQPAAGRW